MDTPEYKDIAEKLQDKFPDGTVIVTGKNQAYIPVQAYMVRLEHAAAGHWHWRLTKDPVLYTEDNAICVHGELTVAGTVRSGIGFSHYVRKDDNKSVSSFKNAVSSAESEAIRNACDKFLMGWKDLAMYREWANNPGVGIGKLNNAHEQGTQESEEVCLKCKQPLTSEDLLFLQVNGIRNRYCLRDVPKHFIKKK